MKGDIKAKPDEFFVPGRIYGKTAIVTSCARGMGRLKTRSILARADTASRPATVHEQVSMMLCLLSDEVSGFTGGVHAAGGGWTAY